MPVQSWTTDDVPQRQRFEYWNDAICRAVLNVSVAPTLLPGFHGSISARRTPGIGYARFGSSAHDIERDRAAAEHAGEETYLLSLQLGGRARITQGENRVLLQDGAVTLVEGWRPFKVELDGPVSRVLALVPRAMLRGRADPLRGGARAIAADAPFADLLRDYMLRLSDPVSNISDAIAERLGDNLCNLLDIVFGIEGGARAGGSELRREALLAHMRRRLADPALSPASAAAHLGISVRGVHQLLSGEDKTFGAWVLEERLRACADTLRSPAARHRRIADIVYGWGFNDVSHFNRAFQ